MSKSPNPTDVGRPTRQRIAMPINFQKRLIYLDFHAQPTQTIEWIYHLKLCVVLHELLFSTQRHRRWIFTLQPLSHSVPFAHVTGCRVVSELRRCHVVRVQEPSTTRPTRVLIVNQVQRLCAFVLNKLEAFWS